MNRTRYFFLFFSLFILSDLAAQGWERYYSLAQFGEQGREIHPTPDGGYLLTGVFDSNVFDGGFVKTDTEGREQNYHVATCTRGFFTDPDFADYNEFHSSQLSSGNIIGFGSLTDGTNNDTLQSIEVVDQNGQFLYCDTIPIGNFFIYDTEPTRDNMVFIAGQSAWNPYIKKIDLDGTIIWQHKIEGFFNGTTMQATNDGGVLLVALVDAGELGNGAHFYKYDANGNEEWSNIIVGFPRRFVKPVINAAGEIYFGGVYWSSGNGEERRIYKLDNSGNTLNSKTFGDPPNESGQFFDLEINQQDELVVGSHFTYNDFSANRLPYRFSLMRLDADLNATWEKEFNDFDRFNDINFGEFFHATDFIPLSNGGYVITGTRGLVGRPDAMFLYKTDSLGNTTTNQICGQIALDQNANCMVNAADISHNIPQLLQLIQGTDTTYHLSNNDGSYAINASTGTYELNIISSNQLWAPCQNAVAVNFPMPYDSTKVNFALEPLVDCPNLSVDIGSTRLRRCRESTFNVQYCNEGTIDAMDAYIEVELDSNLSLTSSDIPGTLLSNNTWRFDLGTVELFECGDFSFIAKVDCGAQVTNRTLCTEARIFPDTLCIPAPMNWSRASLDVSGTCMGDSVIFNIKNVGDGDMVDEKPYIVIEDIAFMRMGTPFKLLSGESIRVPVKATGSTVRLQVEQIDFHPYPSKPNATVEFCGNPPFTTGIFNQLGQKTGNPAVVQYCAQVIGGYDPNEKRASPTGFLASKEIDEDVPLNYEIHFQNTGNDTAFQVILLDTLSANLDLTTLRAGASSHDYEMDLLSENVLRFTFSNIGLVDSFTNEPGSQGFVHYSIKAKKGLAIATKINNAADIYFDYNPPIRTNQTTHAIGFSDQDGDGFNVFEDCDDSNPSVYPTAVEIPNNDVDEDCDGVALIIDDDGDGFNSDDDCDDSNPNINPDATEIPNNDIDENCDGIVLIIDDDMDGFNSDEDCDDSNPNINPDATEIANNDIDENCDGIILIIDDDMDGFNSDEDCDDTNPNINPDATEIANNDIDENCDGVILIIDDDMDGYNSDEDCDDTNPNINPDATEIPNNGIDEDCDGMDATSDVEDVFTKSIKIFPNPTDGVITLHARGGQGLGNNLAKAHITLYSLTGKLLLSEKLGVNQQIHLPKGESGMLILKVETEEGVAVKRVTKF